MELLLIHLFRMLDYHYYSTSCLRRDLNLLHFVSDIGQFWSKNVFPLIGLCFPGLGTCVTRIQQFLGMFVGSVHEGITTQHWLICEGEQLES